MSREIERKFLIASPADAIAAAQSHSAISQGYLSRDPERTVRVRLRDDRGFLTIKSKNHGAERGEWEYPIPADDARELLRLCPAPIIVKTRYLVPTGPLVWEVDHFTSPRDLWLAEVELPAADTPIDLPPWLGPEVTSNPQYYNSNL